MSTRAWLAVAGMLGAALGWATPAHAQVSKDVTRYLMSAASAKNNDQPQEAKSLVDQASWAAKTAEDWRAVAESYRALGDDERWSWALDRSSRAVGRRRRW
jgi:hypothetical protein